MPESYIYDTTMRCAIACFVECDVCACGVANMYVLHHHVFATRIFISASQKRHRSIENRCKICGIIFFRYYIVVVSFFFIKNKLFIKYIIGFIIQ